MRFNGILALTIVVNTHAAIINRKPGLSRFPTQKRASVVWAPDSPSSTFLQQESHESGSPYGTEGSPYGTEPHYLPSENEIRPKNMPKKDDGPSKALRDKYLAQRNAQIENKEREVADESDSPKQESHRHDSPEKDYHAHDSPKTGDSHDHAGPEEHPHAHGAAAEDPHAHDAATEASHGHDSHTEDVHEHGSAKEDSHAHDSHGHASHKEDAHSHGSPAAKKVQPVGRSTRLHNVIMGTFSGTILGGVVGGMTGLSMEMPMPGGILGSVAGALAGGVYAWYEVPDDDVAKLAGDKVVEDPSEAHSS